MAQIVGGLRQRLIRDSILYMLEDGLGALGWNDSANGRSDVTVVPEPLDNNDPVELNTVVLADSDLREEDLELGSNAVITTATYYVDFYAENNTVGRHLINDVRDIIAGRMPSIGRGHPMCVVYDYSLATPVPVFVVHFERIMIDRAIGFPKPWQKHWYTCRFDVIDSYEGDSAS